MIRLILALFLFIQVLSAFPALSAMSFQAVHSHPAGSPQHKGLLKLSELVRERTGGEIIIDVFPGSQLGADKDLIEALQNADLDITCISSSSLSGQLKSYNAFELPFVFPDVKSARLVLDGPIGQEALDDLDKLNLIGLAYFENGFRQIGGKKQLAHPGDIKNLKVNTSDNRIQLTALEALGATPTSLTLTEVDGALRQGDIDAWNTFIPILTRPEYHDDIKYISVNNFFYSPALLIVSKTAWTSLSPEQQIVFREAARDASDYQRSEMDSLIAESLNAFKSAGGKVAYGDHLEWLAPLVNFYKEYEGAGGKEPLDKILKTLKGQAGGTEE